MDRHLNLSFTTHSRPYSQPRYTMAAKTGPLAAEEEVNHFRAIPWCSEHLAEPNLTVHPAFCRSSKPGAEDELLSK